MMGFFNKTFLPLYDGWRVSFLSAGWHSARCRQKRTAKKKRSKKTSSSKKKAASSRSPKGACGKPPEEQKCQNFCELTSDMIQVFKAEGTILEVNRAWRQNLEYTDQDLSQLTVYALIHPRNKKESEDIFLAVLRDGRPRKYQATLIGKNGTEMDIEGTISRLLHDDKPCTLFGVFHDVTWHKHSEQLKDEFVSTVSHELRTPLTIVREGVAQIRDGLLGPVPDGQKAMLDMVLENSDRLRRIIEELLDVSRLAAGKVHIHRKLCDIAAMAHEVAANFRTIAPQKKLEILTDFIPAQIDIYIDRDKIIQVLTNLVSNALKFTESGHIKIHLRILDGFVECKVSDTGKGISGEDLPKVFKRFSQFAREAGPGDRGTGLGLSICKELIELHHGRVKIESVPTKGTTVTFLLPR